MNSIAKINTVVRSPFQNACLAALAVTLLCLASIASADTIYVSSYDNTIRQFSSTSGSGSTFISGRGVSGESLAMTIDHAGNLYVASLYNNAIYKVTPGGVSSVFAAGTAPEGALGLVFDGVGNLYAAYADYNMIQKFAPDGTSSFFALTQNSPQGLAIDGSGNLYVACWASNVVQKFALASGSNLGVFVSGSNGLSGPVGLAFDGSGNLYVANNLGNTITKVTPAGVASTFANTGLNNPEHIAIDGAGNLYAANATGDTVEKYSPAGTDLGAFAGPGLGLPVGIAIRPGADPVVHPDFVTVGNPGNAADATGYGSVGYSYGIGKYDVTLDQYTTFLNAVAKTDTFGLYNPAMATDLAIAGIARSGSPGNFSYSVIGDGNRPVTYVNWFDAARFVNWLSNGQPTGAQGNGTTETGAYILSGTMSGGLDISKDANAPYWIPSENEWYKAAYYDPNKGGSGVGGYWLYPTRSNAVPGNAAGSGTNQANFSHILTPVGAFTNSASAYGTFDQGGEVFQWNDAVISGIYRGLRAGAWSNSAPDNLLSSAQGYDFSTAETNYIGFRVAMTNLATLPASGVTASSAVLNALVNPNGVATTVVWAAGPGPNLPVVTMSSVADIGNGSAPLLVNAVLTASQLDPGTTYSFRVTAVTASGTQVGNVVTFTTLNAPVIAGTAATGVTGTSGTINGTANPNGVDTQVHFEYGLGIAYGSTTPTQAIGSGTNVVPVSAGLTGLAPAMAYHYRMVTVSAAGIYYSPDFTFTTQGTSPFVNLGSPPPVGYGLTGESTMNALVQGNDGNFYGTIGSPFLADMGGIFRVSPDGTNYTLLYLFTGDTDGYGPSGLVKGPDGNFYGTTMGGGDPNYNAGTIFKVTTDGTPGGTTVTTLYSFTGWGGSDGGYPFQTPFYYITGGMGMGAPYGALTLGRDGNLYGTSGFGATVFKVVTDGTPGGTTLTTLVTDWGQLYSAGPLMQASDGNFYGMTGDATLDYGTVFKVITDGTPGGTTVTTINNFVPQGGGYSALVEGDDGSLYGTAGLGGPDYGAGFGAVFKVTTSGSLTVLHTFSTPSNFYDPNLFLGNASGGYFNADGIFPGGISKGIDGNFYGLAYGGGENGTGTVFKITSDGAFTVIHHFSPIDPSVLNEDGGLGLAPLARGNDGGLYAMTLSGGTNGYGTLFKLNISSQAPFISTSPASAVGAWTVTLNDSVNPNGSDTQVYFQYGTSTSYGSTTPIHDIGSGNSPVLVSGSLSGVQPNTTYHYQIVTTGTAGTFYGPDQTFTTPSSQTQYYFSNFAGSPGFSGTINGTGTAALFNNPAGIALDGSGNVYIADSLNSTIRKVTSAGVVTTLAGTPGISGTTNATGSTARFNNPRGIAVDGTGNAYIVDSLNNTIRKVTSGGVVTTLAGKPGVSGTINATGTAARFNNPTGIALDGSGNAYVADSLNNTIRKVTLSGTVTALAGTAGASGSADGFGAAARFNNPAGVAFDASTGNIYVADSSNHTIRKVTLGGMVTTLAGTAGVSGSADGIGTAARFNIPAGIAVDSAGNIYVADKGNHTIRRVTPAGVVTTLGGSPGFSGTANGIGNSAGFNLPFSVALNAAGNVYVADQANSRISIGVPLQVTGSARGFNTAIGALVSGSANPHGLAASTWFIYGPDTNYGSQTPARVIGSGTSFVSVTGTLAGLTLNTTYHYRLAFANSEGIFYGEDRITNVPRYTANDAVVSATSATLSASVNPFGTAGPASNKTNVLVSWQYGLVSGSYTTTTTAIAIGIGAAPVLVSSTVTKSSLSAAIYYYRLIISSALGTTYGPEQAFSVKPPTETYPAAVVTLSGATLSPTVNPNGLDTTVSIQWGLTTAYGSVTTGTDIGSGWTPVTVNAGLTGLASNTAYHYRVVTTNVLGTAYGSDQVFATGAMFGTSVILATKTAIPGMPGATFSALGNPAINDLDHTAFQATLTGTSGGIAITSTNNSGIWADTGTNGRQLIARTGSSAPGYDSISPLYTGSSVGVFGTLSDPVYANNDAVAFLGTLPVAGSVTSANKTGIWATTSGSLTLVARAGDPAPDASGSITANSPVFSSFSQFVLPDQGGVIFLATLVTGTGGVLATNNQGIWAVDTNGVLKQIIRTGSALTVNGSTKIISTVAIFNAPAASTGQARHFNSPGDLTYKVTFTDGVSGFVQSVFP